VEGLVLTIEDVSESQGMLRYPLSIQNAKGKTYYLYQGTTKTGKPRYYFSMESNGALAESIPEGFEIYENPNAQVRIAHGVLLYLRFYTPPAYFFSTFLRNVANVLANWACCFWSMRYSLAVASKAFPRCWRASTL
jgi:hypothetical protein